MDADEALVCLIKGNRRFVADESIHPNTKASRMLELRQAQNPFALVLGCADSRVPPEIIFDCGLGDLFVIRTAGQVVDAAVMSSIEYGVSKLSIPLLVVLGHSGCGAVAATIEAQAAGLEPTWAMHALVEKILPAVDTAKGRGGALLDQAVRVNVEMIVAQLKESAPVARAIGEGRLRVLGACYDLDTGVVGWIA